MTTISFSQADTFFSTAQAPRISFAARLASGRPARSRPWLMSTLLV